MNSRTANSENRQTNHTEDDQQNENIPEYHDTSVKYAAVNDRISHCYEEIPDGNEQYVPFRLAQVKFYRSEDE